MQGTIKMFDPATSEGIVVRRHRPLRARARGRRAGRFDLPHAAPGPAVVFDLDADGRATNVRTGSEPDLGLPTAEI